MKKLLMLLTLSIGLQFSANAQAPSGAVCITNDRDCPIEVRLIGQCAGGACNGIGVLLKIPPHTTKCFTDYNDVIINGITPGTPISCIPFAWHGAEIQSVDCDCGGVGVVIGDGTCANPITSHIYGPAVVCCLCAPSGCHDGCASWVFSGGMLQITVY